MNRKTSSFRLNIFSYPILLSIYIFTGFNLSAPASMAQQSPAADSNISVSTELRRYKIPAQPLSEALIEFGKQSGLQVTTSSLLVEGKQAPSVSGTLSAEQALSQLLAGNNLRYEVNGGMVRLAANTETTALPSVRIGAQGLLGMAESAYRVESANTNVLGKKPLKDTPYSVEVYSNELMKNKQARSLANIAKGDASVDLLVDSLTSENNQVNIRGLRVYGSLSNRVDGLVAIVRSGDLPVEHTERVDILKGASGFLHGIASTGGIINYVLKRPTDEPYQSLSTQVMDSGLALIHADAGGRFGADNRFGYRVNLVYEAGDTYIKGNDNLEDGESRRRSGSIALDWEITPDLLWQFDALFAEHRRSGGIAGFITNSDGSATRFFDIVQPRAPFRADRRYTPSFTFFRSVQELYTTDLTWDFAAEWRLKLAYRHSENLRNSPLPWMLFDSGSSDSYSLFLFNNYFYIPKEQQWQAVVNGAFTTGSITHELAAGISYRYHTVILSLTNPNYRNQSLGLNNVGEFSNPVDVTNPFSQFYDYSSVKPGPDIWTYNAYKDVFLSDTLRLGENWDVILGLRHINLRNSNNRFNSSTSYDESAITPTLAIVYRPIEGLSLYSSYIEDLSQGATAPRTAANANQVFPPQVSRQYEFGAKAEYNDWSASAALFRIEQALTYITPDNVFNQDGEARYQGLELNGKFRFGRHWLLTASAMWLDATNQRTTGGTLDGRRIAGVSREQASLYGEYRLPGIPLTLTAGARYVGKRPVDANSRFYLDDVTLFDIGARYETKVADKKLTLRLNIDNLTDEAYWHTRGVRANWLQQGMPRIFKFGAEVEF